MIDLSLLAETWPQLAAGAVTTIFVTAVSFTLALAFGFVLMIVRVQGSTWFRRFGEGYVALFRVVPELSVILWTYYALPNLIGLSLTELQCGIIALTVIGAAYASEVFRAGFNALPRGQFDAARALGLGEIQAWRLVVAPQIVRRMMPAIINCGIDILKNSTLLAAIGAAELAHTASRIGATTYDYLTPYTVVAVVFFLAVFPLSLIARRREAALQLQRR